MFTCLNSIHENAVDYFQTGKRSMIRFSEKATSNVESFLLAEGERLILHQSCVRTLKS
jgi:hypothetical protein